MGSGKSTTTTNSQPPAAVLQAYQNLIGQATGVASTPYKAYTGSLVAPLTSEQNQGIAGINSAAGIENPYLTAAQSDINASSSISPQDISQFLSPYQSQVVQATQAEENNQNAQTNNNIIGNAVSSGAWGGDRAGVAQGVAAGQEALADSQTIAGLNNQNYAQALSAAQNQAQLEAQAGYGLAGLGNQAQSAALNQAGAELQAGGLQQQEQQNVLNTNYQQWLNQQQYPFQTTGWLANIVEGLGNSSGGTSTSTTNQGGLFGLLGLKRGGSVPHRAIGGMLPYGGGDPSLGTLAGRSVAQPMAMQSIVPTSTNSGSIGGSSIPHASTGAQQQQKSALGNMISTNLGNQVNSGINSGLGSLGSALGIGGADGAAMGASEMADILPDIADMAMLAFKNGGSVPRRAFGGPLGNLGGNMTGGFGNLAASLGNLGNLGGNGNGQISGPFNGSFGGMTNIGNNSMGGGMGGLMHNNMLGETGRAFKSGGSVGHYDGGGSLPYGDDTSLSGQPIAAQSIVPSGGAGLDIRPGATIPQAQAPMVQQDTSIQSAPAGLGSLDGSTGDGTDSGTMGSLDIGDTIKNNPLLFLTNVLANRSLSRGALATVQGLQGQKELQLSNEQKELVIEAQKQQNSLIGMKLQYMNQHPYQNGSIDQASDALGNEANQAGKVINASTDPGPSASLLTNRGVAQQSPSNGQQQGQQSMLMDPRTLIADWQWWNGAAKAGWQGADERANSDLTALNNLYKDGYYTGSDGKLYMSPAYVQGQAQVSGAKAAAEAPSQIAVANATPRVMDPSHDVLTENGQIVPLRSNTAAQSPAVRPQYSDPLSLGLTGNDHAQMPAIPTSPLQESSQKALGDALEKAGEKYSSDADGAQNTNLILDQMKNENQTWQMGWGADSIGKARAVLQGLAAQAGINDPSLTEKVADFQGFQKNAMQLTTAATRAVSPRAAVQEMQMIQHALPSAEMSAQGFGNIASQLQGINDYSIAKNTAAQQWRSTHQGTLYGFDQAWNQSVTPSAYVFKRMDSPMRQRVIGSMQSTPQGKQALARILGSVKTIDANSLWNQ